MNGPTDPPPARVRITSSRRHATPPRRRPLSRDVAEQTGLGQVYVAGLVRAQLQLSLVALALMGGVLFAIPVVFLLLPGAPHAFGVPLAWLLLGFLAYPLLWAGSRRYAQAADQIEQEFTDVVQAQ